MTKLGSYLSDETPEPRFVEEKLQKGRILRTTVPNASIRYFHTRHSFLGEATKRLEWERGRGWVEGYLSGSLTSALDPYLERLARVEGVTQISASSYAGFSTGGGYSLTITKGAAFEWDEIEPAVFQILCERDDMMKATFESPQT